MIPSSIIHLHDCRDFTGAQPHGGASPGLRLDFGGQHGPVVYLWDFPNAERVAAAINAAMTEGRPPTTRILEAAQ